MDIEYLVNRCKDEIKRMQLKPPVFIGPGQGVKIVDFDLFLNSHMDIVLNNTHKTYQIYETRLLNFISLVSKWNKTFSKI